jgi:hypothetical protein
MAGNLRERLLASYADLGEAMVIQNVLEAGGVPCRVADLAQVPSHLFGIAGALGRSVGLWVLEADVDRATSLLATMATAGSGVDEEALEREALAAAPVGAEPRTEPPAPDRVRPARATGSPLSWFARAAVVLVVVLAALATRGCR